MERVCWSADAEVLTVDRGGQVFCGVGSLQPGTGSWLQPAVLQEPFSVVVFVPCCSVMVVAGASSPLNWGTGFVNAGWGVVGLAGELRSRGEAEGVCMERRCSPGAASLPGLPPSWPLQGLLPFWLFPRWDSKCGLSYCKNIHFTPPCMEVLKISSFVSLVLDL